MNKEYFIQLSNYNAWANAVVCSWLKKISEEQWKQRIVSSFNSIEETVLHTVASEKLWHERLSNVQTLELLVNTFKGSKAELVSIWKEMSHDLEKYIESFDEELLTKKLTYKNIKGIEFTMPYYVLFGHIMNHSTYHRGQLVTMLRQAGFTEVSSLDMTTYFKDRIN
jgi:uncharacterized damage-inducible protein DinB